MAKAHDDRAFAKVLTDWLWRAAIAGVGAITIILMLSMWAFSSPVDLEALRRVQVGMNRAEVEAVLGVPRYLRDGRRRGSYQRWLGWEIVYVEYDEQGQLRSLVHDR